MPRIQLTSHAVQNEYRKNLRPDQQRLFDRLARLLAEPRNDLGWYHEVGEQVRALRPENPRSSNGGQWAVVLSEAMGPATGLIYKTSRFVDLYPAEADVQRLERMGADWSVLVLTLPVAKRKDRHGLIRKAKKEGWDQKKLRFEVQKRFPNRRRGMGGRRRKEPQNYCPEFNVREVERLARYWLEFHEKAWEEVKPVDWHHMVRDCSQDDRAKLKELLARTEKQVSEVSRSCKEMRRILAALLKKMR